MESALLTFFIFGTKTGRTGRTSGNIRAGNAHEYPFLVAILTTNQKVAWSRGKLFENLPPCLSMSRTSNISRVSLNPKIWWISRS